MAYEIRAVDRQTWNDAKLGEIASLASFGDRRPHDLDRIDFALVVFRESRAIAFVTCKEMDRETLYWQIGGALGDVRGTAKVVPAYLALIDWCDERYQRIWTRIENSNVRMLHLAMKMGFRVIGTWAFENKIFLELLRGKDGDHK